MPHNNIVKTLQYQLYSATLYKSGVVEFMHDDNVDGCKTAQSVEEFEEMAIDYIKGDLNDFD
jgi:hypothetical protein